MICGNGSNLLSNALLAGNKPLISALMDMNANEHMRDDYGLTPEFWKAYLGYEIKDVSRETVQCLDRLTLMGKTSMQNKLLLTFKAGPPQNTNQLLLENGSNILGRMKDGYAFKVNNKVLSTLKSSMDEEQSILGFIEKLKNNKVFPQGKQYLECVIWAAKIHLIRMIGSGETTLNAIHILALYLYTSNQTIFESINLGIANYKENNIWNPLICCLYQAVSILPPYVGEVYRGVNIKFNLDDFDIGKTLEWNTFAICSKEYAGASELIGMKSGIIFIINSKTGKDISKYSKNPVDAEVIFNPGTKFVVKNYIKPELIAICQANIRNSTYKITDRDIEKALNSEACIIVELSEV
jgi:hypothetical protein